MTTDSSLNIGTFFQSTNEPARNPVSLTGQLTDQVVSEGISEYNVADGQFSHTDSSVPLNYEALLPSGAPLPDFIQFDQSTGTFQFDAEAARQAGVDSIQIQVVASDPDGNRTSSTFQVSFVNSEEREVSANGPTEQINASAEQSSENSQKNDDSSSSAPPPDNSSESSDQGNEPNSTQSSDNPIRLTGEIGDKRGSTGLLTFSISDAFEHTNPVESLLFKATLADGQELPDYVVFDTNTGEFLVDLEQARASGIESIKITVTATDSQGNTAESTFTIEVTAPTEDQLDQLDNLTGQTQAPQMNTATDSVIVDIVAIPNTNENWDGTENRSSIAEQLKLAGKFGYQQEKLTLTKALEKVYGAISG